MIRLPLVITAGGTATLVYELTDDKGQRVSSVVDGPVTVSLRRSSTARTRHELAHLPAVLDPVAATVSLRLTVDQVEALAPRIEAAGKQQRIDIIGDVRHEHGTEIDYYGPFTFESRLPETYDGQTPTVLTLTVMGGLSPDNVPETAELTIGQIGDRIPFPAHTDRYNLIWRLATEPDLISAVLDSDITSQNLTRQLLFVAHHLVPLADGRAGKVWVSDQVSH